MAADRISARTDMAPWFRNRLAAEINESFGSLIFQAYNDGVRLGMNNFDIGSNDDLVEAAAHFHLRGKSQTYALFRKAISIAQMEMGMVDARVRRTEGGLSIEKATILRAVNLGRLLPEYLSEHALEEKAREFLATRDYKTARSFLRSIGALERDYEDPLREYERRSPSSYYRLYNDRVTDLVKQWFDIVLQQTHDARVTIRFRGKHIRDFDDMAEVVRANSYENDGRTLHLFTKAIDTLTVLGLENDLLFILDLDMLTSKNPKLGSERKIDEIIDCRDPKQAVELLHKAGALWVKDETERRIESKGQMTLQLQERRAPWPKDLRFPEQPANPA